MKDLSKYILKEVMQIIYKWHGGIKKSEIGQTFDITMNSENMV